MTELQDAVTQAVQSYADDGMKTELRLAILALAPSIATHIVSELNLEQVWGMGTFVRRDGGSWRLDDITHEDEDRSFVEGIVSRFRFVDSQGEATASESRRAVISRLRSEWVEETRVQLDSRLVELAESDI